MGNNEIFAQRFRDIPGYQKGTYIDLFANQKMMAPEDQKIIDYLSTGNKLLNTLGKFATVSASEQRQQAIIDYAKGDYNPPGGVLSMRDVYNDTWQLNAGETKAAMFRAKFKGMVENNNYFDDPEYLKAMQDKNPEVAHNIVMGHYNQDYSDLHEEVFGEMPDDFIALGAHVGLQQATIESRDILEKQFQTQVKTEAVAMFKDYIAGQFASDWDSQAAIVRARSWATDNKEFVKDCGMSRDDLSNAFVDTLVSTATAQIMRESHNDDVTARQFTEDDLEAMMSVLKEPDSSGISLFTVKDADGHYKFRDKIEAAEWELVKLMNEGDRLKTHKANIMYEQAANDLLFKIAGGQRFDHGELERLVATHKLDSKAAFHVYNLQRQMDREDSSFLATQSRTNAGLFETQVRVGAYSATKEGQSKLIIDMVNAGVRGEDMSGVVAVHGSLMTGKITAESKSRDPSGDNYYASTVSKYTSLFGTPLRDEYATDADITAEANFAATMQARIRAIADKTYYETSGDMAKVEAMIQTELLMPANKEYLKGSLPRIYRTDEQKLHSMITGTVEIPKETENIGVIRLRQDYAATVRLAASALTTDARDAYTKQANILAGYIQRYKFLYGISDKDLEKLQTHIADRQEKISEAIKRDRHMSELDTAYSGLTFAQRAEVERRRYDQVGRIAEQKGPDYAAFFKEWRRLGLRRWLHQRVYDHDPLEEAAKAIGFPVKRDSKPTLEDLEEFFGAPVITEVPGHVPSEAARPGGGYVPSTSPKTL